MTRSTPTIRPAEYADTTRWDSYVTSHPEASPYHLFSWGKSIEEAYNHNCHYLMAEVNEKVAGVFPLVHLHLPFVINELSALPFCDVGNVLTDNESIAQKLLAEAMQLSKKLKARNVSLRGSISIPDSFSATLFPEQNDKVRMFLDLPESSDALMSSFKSKLRSQIRKAEKNKLDFRWGTSNDIDGFYTVFAENMRDLGSPVHAKNWFQAVLRNYDNKAKLGVVLLENEIVGGGIILMAGANVAIPWASTLRRYNNLAPNMLLYWNLLKFAADNNYKTFDFGRSTEGEGTYRFKKQWGAKPTPLTWYSTKQPSTNPKDITNRPVSCKKKQSQNSGVKCL